MKKNEKFLLGLLIISSLVVTSCKNFFNGTDFLSELDKAISYLNKDYADVTITALNSYTELITPPAANYNDKYKAGDIFDLSFSVKSEYQFVGWEVTGDVTLSDPESMVTTVTINSSETPITIEPICKERPQIVTFTPSLTKIGVDRASDIQIVFSNEISLHSIYWTAAELEEMGVASDNYESYRAESQIHGLYGSNPPQKDENGNQYYYAYLSGSELKFKNIEIWCNEKSLLDSDCFESPYIREGRILIIPTIKETLVDSKKIPSKSYVYVTIKSGVENKEGISLSNDYNATYFVSAHYDSEGPKQKERIKIAAITNNENLTTINENTFDPYSLVKDNISDVGISTIKSINNISDILNANSTSSLSLIKPAKLLVLYEGVISDDSLLSDVSLHLTYCENGIYPTPKEDEREVIISNSVSAVKEFSFSTSVASDMVRFDVSKVKNSGIYLVSMEATDSIGNSRLLNFSANSGSLLVTRNVYCLIDNSGVAATDISITKSSNQYTINGPYGNYALINVSKYMSIFGGTPSFMPLDLFNSAFSIVYGQSAYATAWGQMSESNSITISPATLPASTIEDLGALFSEPLSPFLYVCDPFGTLTTFEIIEDNSEIQLIKYIPPKE